MEPVPAVVCRLEVNGEVRECAIAPHTTLLEALRYELGLTGSKQGCDKGDCGACTVVVDGEPVLACISLALAFEEREITTIEGVARNGRPDPLQDAFDLTGAAQCGFCTPGILDRKSTRLNSSHITISYAVFCLKKKKKKKK